MTFLAALLPGTLGTIAAMVIMRRPSAKTPWVRIGDAVCAGWIVGLLAWAAMTFLR